MVMCSSSFALQSAQTGSLDRATYETAQTASAPTRSVSYLNTIEKIFDSLSQDDFTLAQSLAKGLSVGLVPGKPIDHNDQGIKNSGIDDQWQMSLCSQVQISAEALKTGQEQANLLWQQTLESGVLAPAFQEQMAGYVTSGEALAQAGSEVLNQLEHSLRAAAQSVQDLDAETLAQVLASMAQATSAFRKKQKELEEEFEKVSQAALAQWTEAQGMMMVSSDASSSGNGSVVATSDPISSYTSESYSSNYLGSNSPVMIMMGISIVFYNLCTAVLDTLATYNTCITTVQDWLSNLTSVVSWGATYLSDLLNYEIKNTATTTVPQTTASWPYVNFYESNTYNSTYVQKDADLMGGNSVGKTETGYPTYAYAQDASVATSYDSTTTYFEANTCSTCDWVTDYGSVTYYNLSFPPSLMADVTNDLVLAFAVFPSTDSSNSVNVAAIGPAQFANMVQYVSQCLGGFSGVDDTAMYNSWGNALTSSTTITAFQNSLSTVTSALSSDASAVLTNTDNVNSSLQSMASAITTYISSYYSDFAKSFQH